MLRNEKHALVIVPHFDDEIFCAGSFLLRYSGSIHLVLTHTTDTLSSQDMWNDQFNMFKNSLVLINEYRAKKCIPLITRVYIENSATPLGLSEYNYLKLLHYLEDYIKSIDKLEYFVTTIKSSHQSHTQCNNLATTLLRSPFLEKIETILLSPYPQTFFSPCSWSESDNIYNTYVKLDEDDIKILHTCIGDIYKEKNPDNGILGADKFVAALHYYGLASSSEYAQPFICKRLII